MRRLEDFGYSVDPVEVPRGMFGQWALEASPELTRLTIVARHPRDAGFCVIMAGVRGQGREGEGLAAWQARWAGRLWRRNRAFRGLLVALDPDTGGWLLSVPFPDGRADRPGLHHIRFDPELPGGLCGADRERLARLALQRGDGDAEALTARLREELDLRHVTQRFFVALKKAHAVLTEGVEGVGTSGPLRRGDLALLQLNRLIFLYFLQRKGLLDGQQGFMRAQLRRVASQGRGIYHGLLRPLFFGALNTPVAERGPEALELGALPYLNGGLFEPTALELEAPALSFSDSALNRVFDELLERYAFTTREDGAGVGIDPEMLGRAFESLMAAEQRTATGTYFTPRSAVDGLVEQAMTRLLIRIGVPESAAGRLMGGERALILTPRQAEAALTRLEGASILDPACGSGAFLLGALGALERLHRRLSTLAGLTPRPAEALRRQLIARNIFGVDLSPTASRLCELRLWLAILDASPPGAPIEPLPNLDCRVRRGDALLEPVDLVDDVPPMRGLEGAVRDLEGIKADYARASSSGRAFWRHHLEEAERALLRAMIEGRLKRLRRRRDERRAFELSTLPGIPPRERVRARRDWLALEEEIDRLDRVLVEIDGEGFAPAFSPWIHFPEVMARGGFDLIVTNPPWVRMHAIPRGKRALLRRRYEVLRAGAWTAGGALKHLKASGSQVDLSACFVERAIELLAPGGILAALLPSKLARALYGGGVRRLLMTQAAPAWIKELDPKTFPEAKTYPMALVALKSPPAPGAQVLVEVDDAPPHPIPLRALRLGGDDLGSPWLLGGLPPLGSGMARLSDLPGLRVRRGVMTGLNAAFVHDEVEGVEAASAPSSRLPLLRGGDVRAWRWSPSATILWTHDRRDGAPLRDLPAEVEAALAPLRAELEARTGLSRRDPWWRIFRVGGHVFGPKVVWRDIGLRLEAAALPAALPGAGPVVPLNTAYFIPTPTEDCALVLAAWLNSDRVRRCADAIGERAASDYRRFFAWLIELLPMPDALALALRSDEDWRASMASDLDLQAMLRLSRLLHQSEGDPPAEALKGVNEAIERLFARSGRAGDGSACA